MGRDGSSRRRMHRPFDGVDMNAVRTERPVRDDRREGSLVGITASSNCRLTLSPECGVSGGEAREREQSLY